MKRKREKNATVHRVKQNYTEKRGGGAIRLPSSLLAGVVSLSLLTYAPPVLNYSSAQTPNTGYSDNYSLHNADVVESVSLGEVAEASYSGDKARRIDYSLPGVSSKRVWDHTRLTVRTPRGNLSVQGLIINGISYLPARETVRLLAPSVGVSYNSSNRTLTLSGGGLYLTATDGGFVTYANDRPLFAFSPNVVMNDGRMYIPATSLTKALGLGYRVNGSTLTLSGSYSPLLHASRFYRDDEVYWLSKIISAEASGESLLGQIAVGDVILNRVKSPSYPATIYGVIFDRKYGIQFSPTADGRIYLNPTYNATLAAKICLEGTSLSDDAMYFLNPRAAQSSWIVKNRPYAYSIGNHDFYS